MDWDRYLATYHTGRPGITERAFVHARDPRLGSPYDWLLRALPSDVGDVLDVACGNAPLQPRLTSAASYLGVDVSDAELEAARAAGRGPVVHGDARELPVPHDSADTVVSCMGLMLVRPLSRGVAEVARALRPGGTAAFLLPSPWPLHASDLRPLVTLAAHLRGPGSMPQRLSRRRLRRVLRDHGLRVVLADRHRFEFPLRAPDDARLAVQSLYTPGRSAERLAAAESALARLAAPGRSLPVPLLRVVARAEG